jgi:protein CpxP
MNRRNTAIIVALAVGACVAFASAARAESTRTGQSPAFGQEVGRRQGRLTRLGAALELTEEQKAKIQPILREEAGHLRELRQNASLKPEERRAKAREVHQATMVQIRPLLTAGQQKKLDDIRQNRRYGGRNGIRATGGRRMEHLSQALNLTEEQKAKIQPLLEEQARQMRALGENSALSREERRTKARELHQGTRGKIRSLLTADQQKKRDETPERGRRSARVSGDIGNAQKGAVK